MRQLRRGCADTGCDGVNENRFALLQMGLSEKRVMRGDENFRHGCRFHPAQLRGNRGEIAFGNDNKLGLRSSGSESENAVADFPALRRLAQSLPLRRRIRGRECFRDSPVAEDNNRVAAKYQRDSNRPRARGPGHDRPQAERAFPLPVIRFLRRHRAKQSQPRAYWRFAPSVAQDKHEVFVMEPALRTRLVQMRRQWRSNMSEKKSKSAKYPYKTYLNILHGPLEVIDVPALVAACTDKWWNQTLCKVDESVVRLGIVEGEYHWHKHDNEDEFFYVVSGRLLIDLEDDTIDLRAGKGVVIPKGVKHRPRAPERTVILMVERTGIVPTGSDS